MDIGPKNMSIETFEEELRCLDPDLKIWWNRKAGFWQIYKDMTSVKVAYAGSGLYVKYLIKIKDLIATLMDEKMKARPLDMRAIWILWAGDTRRKEFDDLTDKHDKGELIDDDYNSTENNSIDVETKEASLVEA